MWSSALSSGGDAMTGLQKLILIALGTLVASEIGVAVLLAVPVLRQSGSRVAANPVIPTEVVFTPTQTSTPTPIPTTTPTAPPTMTSPPTATATRVVVPTHTPTPSPPPADTPAVGIAADEAGLPTPTSVAAPRARTRATPTPAFPFKVVESQAYETENHFFVLYARITSGNALLAGYRIVGTHSPSGQYFESEPSCDTLCKASGPKLKDLLVQEGNVAFEAGVYETGAYHLVVKDPEGQQVSDVVEIPIDASHRQWFYYHFNR